MARKEQITTDYLVIGAGAMGLAFADEIINMSAGTGNDGTKIVIVDKRANPGGHWNDAYDFVRLHQPSYSYGVASMVLGTGDSDLCSKAQILAYFELALKKMLETGRLRFLAQCEYKGDGSVQSMLDADLEYDIIVNKKTVDASYLNTNVPSTTPPKFNVSPESTLVPINELFRIKKHWEQFVIIGAGKTGIDAILYLLDMNVKPEKITWIMPNDSWLYHRESLFLENVISFYKDLMDKVTESTDYNDLVLKFEKGGHLLRIDDKIRPTKFKCATVSSDELKNLKEIKNIVRQGRVSELETNKITFEDGTSYATSEDYLHVDCTADGLVTKPSCPIFQGKNIILQSISMCQQVYSASVIAALEVRTEENDEKRNAILTPVPHPEFIGDYVGGLIDTMVNEKRVINEGSGFRWLRNNRLGLIHHLPVTSIMKLAYWDYMNPIEEKLNQFREEVKINGRKCL